MILARSVQLSTKRLFESKTRKAKGAEVNILHKKRWFDVKKLFFNKNKITLLTKTHNRNTVPTTCWVQILDTQKIIFFGCEAEKNTRLNISLMKYCVCMYVCMYVCSVLQY